MGTEGATLDALKGLSSMPSLFYYLEERATVTSGGAFDEKPRLRVLEKIFDIRAVDKYKFKLQRLGENARELDIGHSNVPVVVRSNLRS